MIAGHGCRLQVCRTWLQDMAAGLQDTAA
jgi:hypothetical protein